MLLTILFEGYTGVCTTTLSQWLSNRISRQLQQQVKWVANETYKVNDTIIAKPTYTDKSDFIRSEQITESTYFEVKFDSSYYGIGVIKENVTRIEEHHCTKDMAFLFSSGMKPFIGSIDYVHNSRPETNYGDVIGVLVDFENDVVRFFINGRMAATGRMRPSKLRPMHAVLMVRYTEMNIQFVNFIPYAELNYYVPKPVYVPFWEKKEEVYEEEWGDPPSEASVHKKPNRKCCIT
jgi:hypothetical protein